MQTFQQFGILENFSLQAANFLFVFDWLFRDVLFSAHGLRRLHGRVAHFFDQVGPCAVRPVLRQRPLVALEIEAHRVCGERRKGVESI